MGGLSRSPGARWVHAQVARAAFVAVLASVGLLGAAGTASAAGMVTPVLDCVTKLHGGAGWTALWGYSNSSNVPVELAVGPDNVVTPATSNGDQPTNFEPGTHRGVFVVPFKTGNSATWSVSGKVVTATMNAKRCPSPTELPADGNGSGSAIAFLAAAAIGAVALHRVHRQALPRRTSSTPLGQR
jgi:hypothetical protein